MLKLQSIDLSTAAIEYGWGKNCNCLGAVPISFFFVMSQDPKGKMKFERTPAIPAIAGDGLVYGVACLQFLDSSLAVWHFVKWMVLLDTQCFQ